MTRKSGISEVFWGRVVCRRLEGSGKLVGAAGLRGSPTIESNGVEIAAIVEGKQTWVETESREVAECRQDMNKEREREAGTKRFEERTEAEGMVLLQWATQVGRITSTVRQRNYGNLWFNGNLT